MIAPSLTASKALVATEPSQRLGRATTTLLTMRRYDPRWLIVTLANLAVVVARLALANHYLAQVDLPLIGIFLLLSLRRRPVRRLWCAPPRSPAWPHRHHPDRAAGRCARAGAFRYEPVFVHACARDHPLRPPPLPARGRGLCRRGRAARQPVSLHRPLVSAGRRQSPAAASAWLRIFTDLLCSRKRSSRSSHRGSSRCRTGPWNWLPFTRKPAGRCIGERRRPKSKREARVIAYPSFPIRFHTLSLSLAFGIRPLAFPHP